MQANIIKCIIKYITHYIIQGKLITNEGRGAITAPTFVEDFPYHPKPVNDLGASMSGINDKVSLVLFMEEQDEEEQKVLTAMLTKIAEGNTYTNTYTQILT